MKSKTSETVSDTRNRCGICSNAPDTEQQTTTLWCSHTFCLQCIKRNHEAAVKNGQSEADKLYCPRCAEVTAVPDGSVENIRPFCLCNSIKDLHTLSLMNREQVERMDNDDEHRIDSTEKIDSRSYTIEGPTLEDVKELANQLQDMENADDDDMQAHLAEPVDEDVEKRSPEGRYPCSACQAPNVLYYCFSCGQMLCEDCHKRHSETDVYQNHHSVGVSDETMPRLECDTHRSFIRQYCLVCLHGICDVCRTSSHTDHDLAEFCSRQQADEMMADPGRLREHNQYALQKIDELKRNLFFHVEAMNNELEALVQKTRLSEAFISPLKKNIERCRSETCAALSQMEQQMLKNYEHLNTCKAMNSGQSLISGVHDLAIRYTTSDLYNLSENRDECFERVSHSIDVVQVEAELTELKPAAVTISVTHEDEVTYQRTTLEVGECRSDPNEVHTVLEEREPVQDAEIQDAVEPAAVAQNVTHGEKARYQNTMMDADDPTKTRLVLEESRELEQISEPTARANDVPCQTAEEKIDVNNAKRTTDQVLRDETGADRAMEEAQSVTENVCTNNGSEPSDFNTEIAQGITDRVDALKAGRDFTSGQNSAEAYSSTFSTSNTYEDQMTWKTHKQLWSVRQSARSVGFLPNGNILAAGRDKLHTFDGNGRPVTAPFDSSVLTDVWKLAVHRESSAVVVVDPNINAFAVFTPDQSDWSSNAVRWSCTTQNIMGVHVPMCAAFCPRGEVLLGTGSGRSLLKYSPSGEMLWQRTLAHDCYYLTTDTNGRIVSSGGGSVHIHDENGQELYDFPECREQIRDPWGVCTDNHNNIYVCELNRPVVTVFSSSGKYIREMDLNSWPRDIAVQDDKILIASVHSIEMHQVE